MSEHVYKITHLVGSSKTTIEDAINNAITRASKSLRNLRWFVVDEIRGYVDADQVAYYQVTLKVGFTIDDGDDG